MTHLTHDVNIKRIEAEEVKPHEEQDEEIRDVGDGQRCEVVRGRPHPEPRVEEHHAGEEVPHEPDHDQERDVVHVELPDDAPLLVRQVVVVVVVVRLVLVVRIILERRLEVLLLLLVVAVVGLIHRPARARH